MTSSLSATALPSSITALVTVAFLVLERMRPGRELPHVIGTTSATCPSGIASSAHTEVRLSSSIAAGFRKIQSGASS